MQNDCHEQGRNFYYFLPVEVCPVRNQALNENVNKHVEI